MAHASNDHSSDLAYARALSARLLGGPTKAPLATAPRYVRFEPNHALAEPRENRDHYGQVLEACLHESGSLGIFLMDQNGLIIATRGAISDERAQEVGARLQPGLDQVAQINGDPRGAATLCVQVESNWVEATRFVHGELQLTLGQLTSSPLSSESRERSLSLLKVALD